MTSLHKQINHLKPVTIQTLNPAEVCAFSDVFKERVQRLHQLVDLNPHLVSKDIEAAYRWQLNANRELATIESNWPKIPTSVLDQFGFTAKPVKECLKFLYNPISRREFIKALQQDSGRLPDGFGSQNAPPSYHANRGIITATKANKAQRKEAQTLYIQTRA